MSEVNLSSVYVYFESPITFKHIYNLNYSFISKQPVWYLFVYIGVIPVANTQGRF